jgi:hypothetical protein
MCVTHNRFHPPQFLSPWYLMMGTNHEAPNVALFSSLISFCPQVQISLANNSQYPKHILFLDSFTSTQDGQNSQEMWYITKGGMFPITITVCCDLLRLYETLIHFDLYILIHNSIQGGAEKSLAQTNFWCWMELIVSLERGVCSCTELQVF